MPDTPYGYCECGCGQRTTLAPQSHARLGYVKGRPLRFVRGHNNAGRKMTLDRWDVEDRGHSTPCWIWKLRLNAQGYGRVKVRRRQCLAHIVTYEETYGPVPVGLELDHLCRNPACVNPDHLEPVTHAENMRRGKQTKLTPEDARAIIDSDELARVVAARYGISVGYVHNLRGGYDVPRYLTPR